MFKELYTRSPEDPNYLYGVLEHSNALECIISKIKMILNTIPGTVMGDPKFGVDIERLIFQTKINKTDLEEKIRNQIFEYVPESTMYNIQVSVSFGYSDAGYDYAIIDIIINGVKSLGILIS